MSQDGSSDYDRARRLGRQLWWGFVVSGLMFTYLVGVAVIAVLTHLLGVLLERWGVPDDAVTVGRLIAVAVEVVMGLLLAGEAVVSEFRAARARVRGDDT